MKLRVVGDLVPALGGVAPRVRAERPGVGDARARGDVERAAQAAGVQVRHGVVQVGGQAVIVRETHRAVAAVGENHKDGWDETWDIRAMGECGGGSGFPPPAIIRRTPGGLSLIRSKNAC